MKKFEFYTDEHVTKLQNYIENKLDLNEMAKLLVSNALTYVAAQGEDGDFAICMLLELLDGLGLTREEIINAVIE